LNSGLAMKTDEIKDLENYFYKAEDGIRDRNVTGVQTCALSDRLMNNPFFKTRDRFSMSMKKGCPIRVDDDSLLLLFIYASFFFLRRFMIFADKSSKNV